MPPRLEARPGGVGIVSLLSGSSTNAPLVASYDDLAVTSPGGVEPGGEDPVNEAPVAAFTTQVDGLDLDVDGTTSSDDAGVTGYAWDFGDGTTGTGVTTTHTYAEAGAYQATLTVSDGELTDSATVTIQVVEGAVAPSAPVLAQPVVASGVVTLDWDDASNVDTYTVYREFLHKNGTYRGRTAIATLPGSTSTFDAMCRAERCR